jgi:outer membrane protein
MVSKVRLKPDFDSVADTALWGAPRVFAIALLHLFCCQAAAQEVARIPIVDAPPQTPGLGAGFRTGTNPYIGQDARVDLVPLYLYEGQYLFANGTSFGLHAFKNDWLELNAEVRYRFNKLDVDDENTDLAGINDRDQTWEGGATARATGRWGELRLGWFADLDDKHSGYETNLTYRYRFDVGNWMISPYVSGIWLNDKVADYYFGVSEAEAIANGELGGSINAWNVGSAFNSEWGLNAWYYLTDHVFLFGNVAFRGLDENIVNSPIVDNSNETVAIAFLGAGYMFHDDKGKRYNTGSGGINDWSWRVNYGYQSNSNIFPEPMAGSIGASNIVDTRIAGFTLGKLLQGGDRAEFWGKVAAFRHFESPTDQKDGNIDYPETDDFWSFSAYVIAMGKGYSPWSHKLAFRYGFGLGVSYAQEVPLAEKIKQARKGENTNRLLNYLEFMVDFPVDRWIKSSLTKNCFAGVTLVHRSGIFATSDIIGSVAGGSDWVTLSYECVR